MPGIASHTRPSRPDASAICSICVLSSPAFSRFTEQTPGPIASRAQRTHQPGEKVRRHNRRLGVLAADAKEALPVRQGVSEKGHAVVRECHRFAGPRMARRHLQHVPAPRGQRPGWITRPGQRHRGQRQLSLGRRLRPLPVVTSNVSDRPLSRVRSSCSCVSHLFPSLLWEKDRMLLADPHRQRWVARCHPRPPGTPPTRPASPAEPRPRPWDHVAHEPRPAS